MIAVSTQNIPSELSPLLKFTDNRGFFRRIIDFFLATIREMNSRRQRIHNPLRANARQIFPSIHPFSNAYEIDEKQWQTNSKLVVLIHGLNSSPLAWTKYIDELTKPEFNVSCFAPYVYNKGYCKRKEAAQPILDVVQRYATRYPTRPILLIGHSFGAGIAAYIERELDAKDIRLISIAGPHCGTKLINWADHIGFKEPFGFTASMVEELRYQGTWARKQISKWRTKQKEDQNTGKKVTRVFFASADDWRIFPNETSFPNLPNSSYYLLGGESHVTIIDAVRQHVLTFI